jgi:sugar phosphate isomerase/epimerase
MNNMNCNNKKNDLLSSKRMLISVFVLLIFSVFTSIAQNATKEKPGTFIKLALNAYSFNDVLVAKATPEKPAFTLLDLVDWCAIQNIEAIDLTGYYFPGYPEVPTDEYIYELKRKAFKLGIDISGTGIRNNFADPDPAVRAADVERAKKWIIVASKLGAPVIRLFAGAIPKGYENKWEEVAGWMIPCFKECAEFGAKHGVIVGIQNHGDMIKTAEQCIYVMKAVNSNWAGIIVDTGNFKVANPYGDIETVVPYATNWQVKESVIGNSSFEKADYERIMQIIKKTNYRGYIPIETIKKDNTYNPFTGVPQMLKELHAAQDKVFK